MRRGARGTDNRGGESHGPGHAPTSSGVPVKLIVLAGLLVVAAFPVVAMLRTHTSPHTPPAPPAALSPSQRSMNMRGAAAGSAAGPGAGTASPSAGSNVRTPPAVGTPPTLSWPSSDGRADTVAQPDAPVASNPGGVAVDVVIPETAGGSAAESGSTAVDDETGTQVVSPVDSASSDSAAVSVDVPRRDNPVAKRVSPADPFVPLIEPLPQDIDKLVETCALFTDEVKAMHKVLAGEDVAKCGSMKGGSTGAKVQITLKDGTKTVFRPLRCDNYVRCPNFVAEVGSGLWLYWLYTRRPQRGLLLLLLLGLTCMCQVIAAHVAVIMGLPNRVPPVVFRKVDYAWLDSNCGGVKVRPPPGQRKKKKKKKNAGSRKLLALPSGSGDDVNVGAVGGARVGRHLTGLMKRAVDVEKDGTVLGAMQVMWNNIKTSKDVGAKFKPGRSPWIEVRAARAPACSTCVAFHVSSCVCLCVVVAVRSGPMIPTTRSTALKQANGRSGQTC